MGRPSRLSEEPASEVQDERTLEHFPQVWGILNEDIHKQHNGRWKNNELHHEMLLNLAPIVHKAEAGGVTRVGADKQVTLSRHHP